MHTKQQYIFYKNTHEESTLNTLKWLPTGREWVWKVGGRKENGIERMASLPQYRCFIQSFLISGWRPAIIDFYFWSLVSFTESDFREVITSILIFFKAHVQPSLLFFQFHKLPLFIIWPRAFSTTKQKHKRGTELQNPILVQTAFTKNIKLFAFYICNKWREKRMKYIILIFA